MVDKEQVKELLNSVYGITHVYTTPCDLKSRILTDSSTYHRFCVKCKHKNQCLNILEQEDNMKKLEWIKAYMMVQDMWDEIKELRKKVNELEQEKYQLSEQLRKTTIPKL